MSDENELPLGTDLSAKHYVDKAKAEQYQKPVSDQSQNEAAVIAERARQALSAEITNASAVDEAAAIPSAQREEDRGITWDIGTAEPWEHHLP